MANYNNGEYIKEAIESILKQSYPNWELIITDDASTDKSVEIIEPFLSDSRIKFFKHEFNLGCGAAKRNCAINCTGEFLGVLDPDDVLGGKAMEIVADIFDKYKEVGFVYSNHYECDANLNIKGINKWAGEVNEGSSNLHLSKSTAFGAFRRKCYEKTSGFNPFFKKAVDKDIIYKLEEVTKLKFINIPLYYYRMHKNSISLGRNAQKASAYNILAKYDAYKRRIGTAIPNLTRDEIANELLLGSVKFLLSFSFILFFRLFLESVKIKPINFSGYFKLLKKMI